MIQVGRVIAKSGLHLRKKPNAHAEVITTLPFGTVVDIDHQQGKWLLVDCNFKSGYLYKDYVEILEAKPPDLDPPYGPPKTKQSNSKTIAILVIAIVVVIFLVFGFWNGGSE